MSENKKIPQVCIPELEAAINSVLDGGDPLEFVNWFLTRPPEAENLTDSYWVQRVCAVAEMMQGARKRKKSRRAAPKVAS